MHHAHISTEALFFIMLFTLGLAALVVAFVKDARRERWDRESRRDASDLITNLTPTETPFSRTVREGRWAPSTGYTPVAQPQPVYHQAPPYYSGMDPSTSLLTGMLVGEALASGHHHDTTVIHEGSSGSSYVDSSPSYDSGISYDSSSSFDSGSSSGGVDISW